MQQLGNPIVWLLALALFAGCGETTSSTNAPRPPGRPNPSERDSQRPLVDSGTAESDELVRIDEDGRQWIGEIPLDVWFDDPLAIVQNNSQVVLSDNAEPETNPREGQENKPIPETAAADWDSVISREALEDEVKQIRSELNGSLRTVGVYNSSYKEIQVHGATLSALAGIAISHPDVVRWRDNAEYVRDLGTQISEQATGLGRKHFDKTQLTYEQLTTVLDGSLPAGLGEAASVVDFADASDRSDLMRRMDLAFQWLKTHVDSPKSLKSNSEKIQHEAQILAALSKVLSTQGYDSADEPEYQDYLQSMNSGSLAIPQAVQSDNYAGFGTALDRVKKSCDDCHGDYRFDDDF